MSLPSRERGLKYSNHCIGTQCNSVAPFAGAWIEILSYLLQLVGIVASLPSRERGLKFIKNTFGIKFDRSLPSRERGLKWFVYAAKITGEVVAPFAGAWIEIQFISYATSTTASSLPSRERGLKL